MTDRPQILDRDRGGDGPDEHVARVVEETTGSTVASSARVQGGIMNDVYDVRTTAGVEVIVRVARRRVPHFDGERSALDELSHLDVPVARVLALRHLPMQDRVASVIVLTKLPGTPLWGLLDELTDDERSSILRDLGRYAAVIHSVTRSDGVDRRWLGGGLEDPSWIIDAGKRAGFDDDLVRRAIDVLALRPYPFHEQARLVHHDFKAGNVLVENARVTGIVDFEFARAGDPVLDLAYWAYWHGHRYAEPVLTGYRQRASVPGDLDERIRLYGLTIGLHYVNWVASEPWDGSLRFVSERLHADIEWLRGTTPA